MKFKILLLIGMPLLCGTQAFSQEKVYKERISTDLLVDAKSKEEVKRENVDLQSLVESIYISSSKFYNQALPAVKEGEYRVLVNRGDGIENKQITTKELKGISKDQIEELTYKKSDTYGALYGTFAEMFGMVILKLKN